MEQTEQPIHRESEEIVQTRGSLNYCWRSMRKAVTVVALFSLLSCTTPEPEIGLKPLHTISESTQISESHTIQTAVRNSDAAFSLEDRMLLSHDMNDAPIPKPEKLGPLYSFRSHDLPIIDALALFARSNKLNIVSGPEITGTATVDFHDLPLEQAMSALLEAHGYYWEHHDNLIQVRKFKTARMNVDYIRLIRGGAGQNRAQMSSGSTGGGGSQETGQITVNQEDEIKFWEELEKQIETLMSKDGRLVINRLSGTIQVTDWYQRIDEIEDFLKSVHKALHRQVQIEARIYEVNLNDNFSFHSNFGCYRIGN